MEKKDNFDFDVKLMKIEEPSGDFTSKVTSKVFNQLRVNREVIPWMIWIPRVCIGGFILVLLIIGFLVTQHFSNDWLTENFIFGLRAIFLFSTGVFLYSFVDRIMKRIVLGF